MERSVVVSGRNELLALHRALLEAKFHGDPNDRDVAASPLVAKLASEVVAALRNEDPEGWATWLRVGPERREWHCAIAAARRWSPWSGLDRETKLAWARTLLAPFEVDPHRVERFVDAVDAPR